MGCRRPADAHVEPGAKVRITAINGLQLAVKPDSSQIHPESEIIELPTIAVVIIGLYLPSFIKILAEYKRGVIFRLGRLLTQPKRPGHHPGLHPPIDRLVRISLRIDTIEVPPQDVVTRDNVTVRRSGGGRVAERAREGEPAATVHS